MSILDFAKRDYQGIVKDSDSWSVPIKFTSINSISVDVIGHGMSHNTSYGTDGQVVNGKNVHVTVVTADFIDGGYPLINSEGRISLTRHTVAFMTEGVLNQYYVSQYYPDETLGLITCILSEKRS